MTFQQAQSMRDDVKFAAEVEDDAEKAHGLEDKLFRQFVNDLARGIHCDDVAYIIQVAKEIDKVNDLEFERWCA